MSYPQWKYSIHKVPIIIREDIIVNGFDSIIREIEILSNPDLTRHIETNSVRTVFIYHSMRIDDVADRFTHLGAIFIIHETMDEDIFWEIDLSREKHTNPGETMKSWDIFSDDVKVAIPALK